MIRNGLPFLVSSYKIIKLTFYLHRFFGDYISSLHENKNLTTQVIARWKKSTNRSIQSICIWTQFRQFSNGAAKLWLSKLWPAAPDIANQIVSIPPADFESHQFLRSSTNFSKRALAMYICTTLSRCQCILIIQMY